MKEILSITILFLLPFLGLQAQKTKQEKWRYSSLTQGGITVGSSTASYVMQTIQGVQKNGLFTGVGIGIDDYGMPGLPLVAHMQQSFTKNANKPFVYGQAGVFLPLKKGQWNDKVWRSPTTDQYDLHKGFVGEIGGGYLFGLGKAKKHAVALSAGYSYKHTSATFTQLAWPIYLSSLPPAGYDKYITEDHTYNYHRIVAKIGFMF